MIARPAGPLSGRGRRPAPPGGSNRTGRRRARIPSASGSRPVPHASRDDRRLGQGGAAWAPDASVHRSWGERRRLGGDTRIRCSCPGRSAPRATAGHLATLCNGTRRGHGPAGIPERCCRARRPKWPRSRERGVRLAGRAEIARACVRPAGSRPLGPAGARSRPAGVRTRQAFDSPTAGWTINEPEQSVSTADSPSPGSSTPPVRACAAGRPRAWACATGLARNGRIGAPAPGTGGRIGCRAANRPLGRSHRPLAPNLSWQPPRRPAFSLTEDRGDAPR